MIARKPQDTTADAPEKCLLWGMSVSILTEKMKVAVCVITYRRPKGLKRLIESLNKLAFDKCKAPNLQVIVVDNDPAGLAYKFCEVIRSDLNWPLKRSVEPRRGIPHARNKAVACAQEEHVDFIAFLDDDEVPEPSWLDELLYIQELYYADVVAGPVLPRFTEPVAPWMEKGKFFERRRLPTGDVIDWAATNNVLVCSEVFEKMDKLFDERFALTGGSDKDFFMRVHRRGYKMVWADDAIVYELVPKSRANVRWLLQRQYRVGNNHSMRAISVESSLAQRASLVREASWLIIRGLWHIPQSILIMALAKVICPITGGTRSTVFLHKVCDYTLSKADWANIIAIDCESPSLVRGLRRNLRSLIKMLLVQTLKKISRGAGILAGVAGGRYEEYQRTHSE